jgi:hypothetical protein
MSDIPETADLNWIAHHLLLIGFAAVLALLSSAALAEQGTSSSWGSVGAGPHISTQALTPFDRQWNFDNQAKYQAQDSADWLRQHGKGLFSFFGAATLVDEAHVQRLRRAHYPSKPRPPSRAT